MKEFLSNLIIFLLFLLGIAIAAMLIVPHLPVNERPCFGKTSDGRIRWHSYSECAHD